MDQDAIIHEQILSIASDFENLDFLPHPGDKIIHSCGSVTTFTHSTETFYGIHVDSRTVLASTIPTIQIKGMITV